MENLIGKYVAVHPRNSGASNLGRLQVLYVVSETKKQVKAKESPESSVEHTIQRSEVLGIVYDVPEIRIKAMNIQNEYYQKRKELFETYLEKMTGIFQPPVKNQ